MKDDLISRQAAKLKVARVIWEDGDSCYDFQDKCVDCLDDVPSAQPETHDKRTETHACDLISRQAAIDAYGDYYVEEGTDDGFIGTVKQLLEGLPSAQPEIIHCRDCKYHDENEKNKATCWLPCMSMYKDDDWYCGSAERRTDG